MHQSKWSLCMLWFIAGATAMEMVNYYLSARFERQLNAALERMKEEMNDAWRN